MFVSQSFGAMILAIGAVAACSSREAATSPSQFSMAGIWNQGARLADTTLKQTHIHTGYFFFDQEGGSFAGTGQQSGFCHSETGDYVGPLATGLNYDITQGVQHGRNVSFQTDLCSYEGVMTADGAHINGTARCEYTDQGLHFVWTGDWLANREP